MNLLSLYATTPLGDLRHAVQRTFLPSEKERQENSEVSTSVLLVDEMLDQLPADFFTRENAVLEPCCGKGNFLLALFTRFFHGLVKLVPDAEKRVDFIFTNCLYFADISGANVALCTALLSAHAAAFVPGAKGPFKFHTYVGDTLKTNLLVHFGLRADRVTVVGNPPYTSDYSTASAKKSTQPLYHKFIELYLAAARLLFVVPSRWFLGGKGLSGFRAMMLNRTDLRLICHREDPAAWFTTPVELKGGAHYFFKDAAYGGPCLFNGTPYRLNKYDSVVDPAYHAVIDQLANRPGITSLYKGRFFKIETTDPRLKATGSPGATVCYVSAVRAKNRINYIENFIFNSENTFWKVFTPKAAHEAHSGFGEIFIGNPDEIHSNSYLSFAVATQREAVSLASYLKTDFANRMLAMRKISHNLCADTCKWIPLLPLDRLWDDAGVAVYLGI